MTPDQFTAHQIDWLYRAEADRIAVWEDSDSVRSPGWFQAQCTLGDGCEWETSGAENTVKGSVREHVGEHPLCKLLSAVSGAVRERGEKLERLPQVLGEIWPQERGSACAITRIGAR